jgi:hypothetical protein
MPIPAFTSEGLLPEGVHDCSLTELEERFGQFQTSDIRCRLFERLTRFVHQAAATGLVSAIILDGSFVTSKDNPNDIDLILVLRAGHDLAAVLRPFEYNVISRRQISREFGFDMLLTQEGHSDVAEAIAFFSQVRKRVDVRKGMLRIRP